MPANTHLKQVLNADVVPEGPNRWPWSTARVKTSAPSSRLTFLGVLKSRSANEMSIRCFHWRLKGTGYDGRTDIILGSTKVSTSRVFPSLPKLVILKSTMPHNGDFIIAPPILLIFMLWCWCSRRRCCAKCSVMNDAGNAESVNALALFGMTIRACDSDLAHHQQDLARTTYLGRLCRYDSRILLAHQCCIGYFCFFILRIDM